MSVAAHPAPLPSPVVDLVADVFFVDLEPATMVLVCAALANGEVRCWRSRDELANPLRLELPPSCGNRASRLARRSKRLSGDRDRPARE